MSNDKNIFVKVPVNAGLISAIAKDLKFVSQTTKDFLCGVIKSSVTECINLQPELEAIIDAGTEADSIDG